MSILFWIPLMIGCVTVPSPPPVAGGDGTVLATTAGPPAVSFVPLEERVNVLVAEAQDTDRRDRLVAARELMQTMRNKDAIAQRKVYEYLDAVLTIEERARPAPIGMDPIGVPIEEEPLGGSSTAPTGGAPLPLPDIQPLPSVIAPAEAATTLASAVVGARAALAESRYLDAVALLQGVTTPEASTLRKEAVDGWARTERERAGHMFLEARQLPPGGERVASLRAARIALAAINERFPDNAYAAQIAENIAKVDADLAAVGARP
ncbi:MAG: hypothetical protein Q8P18_34640 [Pseudomonadota bacterium]|nr:hypothetical protein [Pseudomonadota bacterium]